MKKTLLIAIPLLWIAACSPAPASKNCDSAQFVDHVIVDVPVQDGTSVMPGTHFTKTWEVINNGSCDWTLEYALVNTGGDPLGAPTAVNLTSPVTAGQTADLAISMTAPIAPGTYSSEWLLQNAQGERFGVGPEGDRPLFITLVVPDLPDNVKYDFTQVMCLAQWHSNRAQFLPCDGTDDDDGILNGYVRLNAEATQEGSPLNTSPVIEMKPNNQPDGWVAGFFPPITILSGDRFLATVGCLEGYPHCSIAFRIDYELEDGTHATLAELPQVLDGEPGQFDVDLTSLAGEDVTLVLVVMEDDGMSREARGYWLNPRIEGSR